MGVTKHCLIFDVQLSRNFHIVKSNLVDYITSVCFRYRIFVFSCVRAVQKVKGLHGFYFNSLLIAYGNLLFDLFDDLVF